MPREKRFKRRKRDGQLYDLVGIDVLGEPRLSRENGMIPFHSVKELTAPKYHWFMFNTLNLLKGVTRDTDVRNEMVAKFIRETWAAFSISESRVFSEGERRHVTMEQGKRSSEVVAMAKASFLDKFGRLFCEINPCHFEFDLVYGADIARGFIEAHHMYPFGRQKGMRNVVPSDFKMLCANCHRIAHVIMRHDQSADWSRVKELLERRVAQWKVKRSTKPRSLA